MATTSRLTARLHGLLLAWTIAEGSAGRHVDLSTEKGEKQRGGTVIENIYKAASKIVSDFEKELSKSKARSKIYADSLASNLKAKKKKRHRFRFFDRMYDRMYDKPGNWHGQTKQDKKVMKILQNKRGGFFVDLAANEPIQMSNTRALERDYGWTGLCVDGNQKM